MASVPGRHIYASRRKKNRSNKREWCSNDSNAPFLVYWEIYDMALMLNVEVESLPSFSFKIFVFVRFCSARYTSHAFHGQESEIRRKSKERLCHISESKKNIRIYEMGRLPVSGLKY